MNGPHIGGWSDVFFWSINEIAPFAYNQGVEDAQKYIQRTTEDLPGTCFQEPLTHWKTRSSHLPCLE